MFSIFYRGYGYYIVAAFQIVCILHALKTNRRDWIYLLIFLPGVGAIIYIIREILPGIRLSERAGNFNTIFAGSRIRELERNCKIAETDANKLRLAEEHARQKNFEKAMSLTSSCLKGIYANNPGMMLDMGRYSFGAGQYAESLNWFDKALREKNNRFDKPEDELLYARALDQSGDKARAEAAYKQIIRVHHSMQGRYHYGMLLKTAGRKEEARLQFRTVLEERNLHPRHVRRINAEWVNASRKALAGL